MSETNYTIHKTGNTTPVGEPIQHPSVARRIFQGLIALVFVAAMLNFSGLYQSLQFSQTGDEIAAGSFEPLVSGDVRVIPANIYLLSTRGAGNPADVVASSSARIVAEANEILAQSAVFVEVDAVSQITATTSPTGPELVSSNDELRQLLPDLEPDELSIVLTRGLAGINGVAFGGTDVVAVAEYTTSFDFRVLAHEVGHVLGEGHVDDRGNLMSSGGTGTTLTDAQAERMYSAAERFVSQ